MLLATDASVTVGVRLAGTGQIGVVSGTGKAMTGSGLLRLQVFDVNAVLHPGEQLVTFGSVGGRSYVPGVPVGVITKLEGVGQLADQGARWSARSRTTPRSGVVGVVDRPAAAQPAVLRAAAVADPGPEGHRHGDPVARRANPVPARPAPP